MLSIQKIFGRDETFYDLLEKSAEEADASVHHLIALSVRNFWVARSCPPTSGYNLSKSLITFSMPLTTSVNRS